LVSLLCEIQICESLFVKVELRTGSRSVLPELRIREDVLLNEDEVDVLLVKDEGQRLHRPAVSAQVGEWLKPTDCKSVPPSEVRRFESFPVHHI
jgi:hypothetical protein